MPYEAEISRSNPSCFLFLIDQSGSMVDPIMGVQGNPLKAQFVADALNKIILTLAVTASKDAEVRRYYQVGVIGYGSRVGPALGGALSGQELVWIDDLYNNPLRVEDRLKKQSDGAGGVIEVPVKFPIWFEPVGSGSTPMGPALEQATQIVRRWAQDRPTAYPPTVINLTDGEPDPGADPILLAEELKAIATSDGRSVLLTVHVSSNPYAKEIFFPSTNEVLPDEFSRRMYTMCSPLTPRMLETSSQMLQIPLQAGARGIVYNAGIDGIVQALEIGTRPSNLR
jgi:uncharacterized protein YegL